VAKYQATQVDAHHADAGMPYASISVNPLYDVSWLAYKGHAPLKSKKSKIFKPISRG